MLNVYTCAQFSRKEGFEDVAKPLPSTTETAKPIEKDSGVSSTATENTNGVSSTATDQLVVSKIPFPKPPTIIKSVDTLVGKTFKLFVSIPTMPTYIKGENFTKTSKNTFYLSVEKLDPNCSIKLNKCSDVYIDNKNCKNSELLNLSNDGNRLVLASSKYGDDPTMPIGKNNEFTIVMTNNKYYLKNINTNMFVTFSVPAMTKTKPIYGTMINDDKSNLKMFPTLGRNIVCVNGKPNETNISEQKDVFITCNLPQDNNVYLSLTKVANDASPIDVIIKDTGKISINLQYYNNHGFVEMSMPLATCKFNVNTQEYIERVTNPAGSFFINMVCLNHDRSVGGADDLVFDVIM